MSEDKPDLAAVLNHYGVVFSPNRSSQKCLCPVHDDHIKSCSLNLDEQWFVCHACGAKGDSWNLIMAIEGCDYSTAKQYAEGFARASGSNIREAAQPTTDGLFGRQRAGRRNGDRKPVRPSLGRS